MCAKLEDMERRFKDDPEYNIPDECDCSPDSDEYTEERKEPNGSQGS